MTVAERDLEDAQNRFEKAVREVLRERNDPHAECDFRDVVSTPDGFKVSCAHGEKQPGVVWG